jgi:hypothetical protein
MHKVNLTNKCDSWLSITQAAKFANVTHRSMQRWVASKKVQTTISDGRRLVLKSSIPKNEGSKSAHQSNQSNLVLWPELLQLLDEMIESIPIPDVKTLERRQQLRHMLKQLESHVGKSLGGKIAR